MLFNKNASLLGVFWREFDIFPGVVPIFYAHTHLDQ